MIVESRSPPMISTFQLKAGRTPGSMGQPITATPITVFVGPNNSGKSRILSELHRYCTTGSYDANSLLLAGVQFQRIGADRVDAEIERLRLRPGPGEVQRVGDVILGN